MPNSRSPLARGGPGAVDLVEDPRRLGTGEVGGEWESGRAAEPVDAAVRGQPVADPLGPGVLPDDGRMDRLPGRPLPDDGRLPLVGDADGDRRRRGPPPGPAPRPRPGACWPRSRPGRARPIRDAADAGVLELVGGDGSAVVSDQQAAVLVVPWSIAATYPFIPTSGAALCVVSLRGRLAIGDQIDPLGC